MNKPSIIAKICVLSLCIYLVLNIILNLNPMRGIESYLIALVAIIIVIIIDK